MFDTFLVFAYTENRGLKEYFNRAAPQQEFTHGKKWSMIHDHFHLQIKIKVHFFRAHFHIFSMFASPSPFFQHSRFESQTEPKSFVSELRITSMIRLNPRVWNTKEKVKLRLELGESKKSKRRKWCCFPVLFLRLVVFLRAPCLLFNWETQFSN